MTPGICTREGSMYFKLWHVCTLEGLGMTASAWVLSLLPKKTMWPAQGHCLSLSEREVQGSGTRTDSSIVTSCLGFLEHKLRMPPIPDPTERDKNSGSRSQGGLSASVTAMYLFHFSHSFPLPSQERTKHLDSKPLSSSPRVLDNKCFLFLKCFLKNCCQLWGWRGILKVVKSTCCSWRGSGFCFYHSCDGSQPSVTPVLGYSRPSSNFHGH